VRQDLSSFFVGVIYDFSEYFYVLGINILHPLGLKVENRFLNLFVLIIQYTINNNTRKKKGKTIIKFQY
jgi:hypothetical protein